MVLISELRNVDAKRRNDMNGVQNMEKREMRIGMDEMNESEESKEKYEMNGNDETEWNESIGMEMDRSECD